MSAYRALELLERIHTDLQATSIEFLEMHEPVLRMRAEDLDRDVGQLIHELADLEKVRLRREGLLAE